MQGYQWVYPFLVPLPDGDIGVVGVGGTGLSHCQEGPAGSCSRVGDGGKFVANDYQGGGVRLWCKFTGADLEDADLQKNKREKFRRHGQRREKGMDN